MGLRDWLKGKPDTIEPLELKQQILDEVAAKITPVGGGQRIFPYPRLAIQLFAPDEEQRGQWQQAFIAENRLAEAVRDYLQPRCTTPRNLALEVSFVEEPWPAWTEQRSFRVSGLAEATDAAAAVPSYTAQLIVLQGQANKKKLPLTRLTTYLGRLPQVADAKGRVVQRNDLCFEAENEVNRTVSRQHAHIVIDQSKGEYYLYDDGSTHGTVIFRLDGARLVVARRIPTPLQDGDEINLGDVCLRFNKKVAAG